MQRDTETEIYNRQAGIVMEYRFRGYDVTCQKGWVYGDLAHTKKILKDEPFLADRVMVGGYEVHPESVGLWTGLVDRNCKYIYEGDIVKHPYIDPIFGDIVESKDGDGVTSEVVFHDGAFVVKYDDDDYIYLDAFTRHGHVEVVGNVFENNNKH